MIFRFQPRRYFSGGAKVAFVISLLSGQALKWATAALGQNGSLATDFTAFGHELRSVFNHPIDGTDAATRLHSLQQGSRSVAEYTVEFQVLAADSGWDDRVLYSAC